MFGPADVDESSGEVDLGYAHGLRTGDEIVYSNGGDNSLSQLDDGMTYFAIVVDPTTIKLTRTQQEAEDDEAITNLQPSDASKNTHSFRRPDENLGGGGLNSQGEMLLAVLGHGVMVSGSLAATVTTGVPTSEGEVAAAAGGAGKIGIGISGAVSVSINTVGTRSRASDFNVTHVYADDNPTGTPSDTYAITAVVTDDDGGASETANANAMLNNVAPTIGALGLCFGVARPRVKNSVHTDWPCHESPEES